MRRSGPCATAADLEQWVTSPETKPNQTKDLSTKANVWWKGRKMWFLRVFDLGVTLQMRSGETKCSCVRNGKEKASWADEQAETRQISAVKCGGLFFFQSCQRPSSDGQERPGAEAVVAANLKPHTTICPVWLIRPTKLYVSSANSGFCRAVSKTQCSPRRSFYLSPL